MIFLNILNILNFLKALTILLKIVFIIQIILVTRNVLKILTTLTILTIFGCPNLRFCPDNTEQGDVLLEQVCSELLEIDMDAFRRCER
jgi:hypothetical protein